MFSLFLLRNIEHQQLSVPCYFYHSPYYSHAEKTTLSISKGVFFMSNSLTLTRRNCGQYIEKNMELPQNCRSISAETFFNRPDIRSVVFPYEMEQIGNKAFQGCSRLSRIELPEHLQKLGIGVFSDCISLKKSKFPPALPVFQKCI